MIKRKEINTISTAMWRLSAILNNLKNDKKIELVTQQETKAIIIIKYCHHNCLAGFGRRKAEEEFQYLSDLNKIM